MRLIDADALRMLWLDEDPNLDFEINTVLESIDEQPTIDAEPVRHGTWEAVASSYWRWYPNGGSVVTRVTYRCSRCRRGTIVKTDYCTCGAKMDGGASDD